MPQIALSEHPRTNPLDVVERIAAINDWSFERAGDDEITMLVGGKWSDYQVSFTWMHDIEALHLACAFDLKVPERRRAEVQQLIAHGQRATVGRAFRPVDQGRHGDVPPRAGAGRRRRGHEPAMPGAARPARSKPARAISRPSSSWSGPASPRARRSTPRCSRPPARRKASFHRQYRLVMPREGGRIQLSSCRLHTDRACVRVTGSSACADDDSRDVAMAKSAKQNSLAAIPGALVLVGAGKMGGAMLDGWLARKLPPKKVVVLEPQPSKAIKALAQARRAHQSRRATSARSPRW